MRKRFARTRAFLLWAMAGCMAAAAQAQAPAGYYDGAEGKRGAALKTALHRIISDHDQRTYKELWTDFLETDRRDDGCVWDMYSSSTDFAFQRDQCGNYKYEGDCYNREHSMPKSWFNDAYPMYTDLFHLYPTDGYVNNRRSNYPFGETKGERYKSEGGFSKLGNCTYPGYTGVVFEPNDEYKGDFARTYFYMVTCYEDRVSGWDSDMLNRTAYPAFAAWAVEMLLEWSREDPVSQKEVDRNNAVYRIQGNRNPFIDLRGLEEYVWGARKDEPFEPTGMGALPMPRLEVRAEGGCLVIRSDAEAVVPVYDVVGRMVRRATVAVGETRVSLPPGIYIVARHKVAL